MCVECEHCEYGVGYRFCTADEPWCEHPNNMRKVANNPKDDPRTETFELLQTPEEKNKDHDCKDFTPNEWEEICRDVGLHCFRNIYQPKRR